MTSVTTDRRLGVNAGLAFKVPCRAATTANITLSGEHTVDGVALVTGDRCLVKNQTSGVNNGIYDVDTGDWTRSPDADGSYDLAHGSLVLIVSGTVNSTLVYECTASDPITIGTTSLTWAAVSPSTPITLPLSIAQGGTGQSTKATALAALGVVSLTGAGGTANAQTAAAPASYTALTANDLLEYTPAVTNTSAVNLTITPSGGGALAAQAIKYDGAACAGGELVLGVPTLLLCDGAGNLNIVGYSRKIRSTSLGAGFNLINGTIVQTRAASAETIAIKTLAGADPSAADPVGVVFRDQASTTGGYVVRWLTAALSLTISSGSTMGARNSIPFRLWYVLFDDAGTVRLAAINCVTTVAGAGAGSDVTSVYPLGGFPVASSTAEGGAGAADSAQTFYTGVAVSAKPYVPIGYATWEAGLAAVGTWGTAPSRIHLYARGTPLPGQPVQLPQRNDTGTSATFNPGTIIPNDNTIPQNTEGDQVMSQAITPTSAANILCIRSQGFASHDAAGLTAHMAALFQDATANALAVSRVTLAAANNSIMFSIDKKILAAGTAATTFKVRIGDGSAGISTFIGAIMGGVETCFLEAIEVMG